MIIEFYHKLSLSVWMNANSKNAEGGLPKTKSGRLAEAMKELMQNE